MIFRLILLATLLILGACSTTTQPTAPPLWSFNGKFSLRSEGKNQSGYIDWRQYKAAYSIRLWGSFGLGTTKIEGNPRQLHIDTGKQQRLISSQDETELLPGLHLPLGTIANEAEQLLRHCEVGIAKPISGSNRWRATCERATANDNHQLAQKVRISDGSTSLILLIKAWN